MCHAHSTPRHAEFLHSAEDSLHAYLVFHAPRLTLARVLKQERFDMIPKAQVREIMTQIVCAVGGKLIKWHSQAPR